MTQEFHGRLYRKMSGRRYVCLQEHLTPVADGQFITHFSHFARMIALSLSNADGSWAVAVDDIESKVSEIIDEWTAEEVLQVGTELMDFNNLGLKAEETVEKN